MPKTKKQSKIAKKFCYVCKTHVIATEDDFRKSGHSDEKVRELLRSIV